jgi:hypothetical protein
MLNLACRIAFIALQGNNMTKTARQIIEARLGRKLPPTKDLPPDLRKAVYRLALQLLRVRP